MNGTHLLRGLALTTLVATLNVACTPTVTADRRSQPDFLVEVETPGVESAIIEPRQVWYAVALREVWVSRLNDQASAGPWTKLEVAPGRHCVVIDTTYHVITWPEYARSEPLCFEAEPGGHYQVDHAHKAPDNYFWVVDMSTRAVVAGERPG